MGAVVRPKGKEVGGRVDLTATLLHLPILSLSLFLSIYVIIFVFPFVFVMFICTALH